MKEEIKYLSILYNARTDYNASNDIGEINSRKGKNKKKRIIYWNK